MVTIHGIHINLRQEPEGEGQPIEIDTQPMLPSTIGERDKQAEDPMNYGTLREWEDLYYKKQEKEERQRAAMRPPQEATEGVGTSDANDHIPLPKVNFPIDLGDATKNALAGKVLNGILDHAYNDGANKHGVPDMMKPTSKSKKTGSQAGLPSIPGLEGLPDIPGLTDKLPSFDDAIKTLDAIDGKAKGGGKDPLADIMSGKANPLAEILGKGFAGAPSVDDLMGKINEAAPKKHVDISSKIGNPLEEAQAVLKDAAGGMQIPEGMIPEGS